MKTVLNWSSGKDAAMAFHMLQQDSQYEVAALLTTINTDNERIVMHGVREELLEMQADRINLPLMKVHLPPSPDHDVYNAAMEQALYELQTLGITHSAFGDIHLEDLRQYREEQLKQAGFGAVFPLWGKDTRELVQLVETSGIEAIIVCVSEKHMGKEFLGRKVDTKLLSDLPEGVDPCGENGEFHTFVYNAPFFSAPIGWASGEVVRKVYTPEDSSTAWDKGFYFMDILPGD
ncbi:MAG TPA: ATP-binding protein [Flavipsychrobacter sp.]